MENTSTTTTGTTQPKKAKKAAATTTVAADPLITAGSDNKTEAKSRFNAALEEAKAGAAALKAEATERAGAYRDQAKVKSGDLSTQAKAYGGDAKVKASELANDGKAKASDALSSLGKVVADSAEQIDEKLGAKYGDYARTASRSLQEASVKLETKSVDELSEDAREMVRKSPGMALGIAAVAGFMLSRLFRGRS